jgi:hypothetical protein
MIELPEGWTSWKTLKLVEPELVQETSYFNEDMFCLKSPDGRFMLDIGWYGGDVDAGSYKCYLVEMRSNLSEEESLRLALGDGPWDNALETFSTRKTSEVLQWLSKTISTIHAKHYAPPRSTAKPESFLFQHYEKAMLDGSGTHHEYVIINDISDGVALALKKQFEDKHPGERLR